MWGCVRTPPGCVSTPRSKTRRALKTLRGVESELAPGELDDADDDDAAAADEVFADALDDAASSPVARRAAARRERYSPETDRLHSLYERGRYVQERRLLDARRDAAAAESALARSPAPARAASSRINALYERGKRQVARAVRASLPPPSWEERHGVAAHLKQSAAHPLTHQLDLGCAEVARLEELSDVLLHVPQCKEGSAAAQRRRQRRADGLE